MPQIERVTYEKVFPLAPYVNEKIGVSYLLMENDDPKEALQAAKKLCEEFHKESNNWPNPHIEEKIIPDIKVENGTKSTTERLIDDIYSCQEIKVLESYKLIAKSNPVLQIHYDNRLKQLTNE